MARDVRCLSRSQRSTHGNTKDKNAKKETRNRQTDRRKKKKKRPKTKLKSYWMKLASIIVLCNGFLRTPPIHYTVSMLLIKSLKCTIHFDNPRKRTQIDHTHTHTLCFASSSVGALIFITFLLLFRLVYEGTTINVLRP